MSIQDKAVLVSLNISCWSGNKTDRDAARDIENSRGAESGTFKAIKNLLPEQAALKDIKTLCGSVRNGFYEKSLPWNRGQYIMPADIYEDWQASFNDDKEKFAKYVESFKSDYGRLKDIAKRQLGSAFSADDYPSEDILDDMFTLDARVEPIAGDDWRVEISAEQKKVLERDWNKHKDDAIREATHELWTRLSGFVDHYCNQLENGKRLHDTTVTQLAELCENIPSFNLAEDGHIVEAKDAIKEALADLSMGDIKADKTLRSSQAQNMRAAQDKMAGLMKASTTQ